MARQRYRAGNAHTSNRKSKELKFWPVFLTLAMASGSIALLIYLVSKWSSTIGIISAIGVVPFLAWLFPRASRRPMMFAVALLLVFAIGGASVTIASSLRSHIPIDVTNQIELNHAQEMRGEDIAIARLDTPTTRRLLTIQFQATDYVGSTQYCTPGTSLQVALNVAGNQHQPIMGRADGEFTIDLGNSLSKVVLDIQLSVQDPGCVMSLAIAHATLHD